MDFGPSNLSLASALEEFASGSAGQAIDAVFFEKQAVLGWHRGMLLPGAKMQISFLKDPVIFRNPVSPYSYVAYLHSAGQATFEVVTATVQSLEQAAGTGWDMTDSLGCFRRIQPSVGAFRVHVESVEAMFKLSQEHIPQTRRSIRAHLSASVRGLHRELSEAMRAEETGPRADRPALASGVRQNPPQQQETRS